MNGKKATDLNNRVNAWKKVLPLQIGNLILSVAACLMIVAGNAAAESTNEIQLLELANKHFTNNISQTEKALFRAAANGTELKGWELDGRTSPGKEDNPTNAAAWSLNRVIRADRLAWLCADPSASAFVDYHGIRIIGLRVVGDLDLEWAKVSYPLSAKRCTFATRNVNLSNCRLSALDLAGTFLDGLRADGAKIDGDVFLDDGFIAAGEVDFMGAAIGQNLNCDGGQFFNTDINHFALRAVNAQILGSVFLSKGFKAEGRVDFMGATIGHDLDCTSGQFMSSNVVALNAEGAKIGGYVFLYKGFNAAGMVNLMGAAIGQNLECETGKFLNTDTKYFALIAENAKIEGNVHLRKGFNATGEVNFMGATIGQNLECDGGQFFNPDINHFALSAENAKIDGSVFLRKGFNAAGGVDFINATIGQNLVCDGFKANGNLIFRAASIGNYFDIRNVTNPEEMTLDLTSLRVGTLTDEKKSWPKAGHLFLDNFVYERIDSDAPADANSRTNWLQRQPADTFLPQPYDQLAKTLINMGRENDAAEVMIAKNQDYGGRLHWLSPRQWPEIFWYKIFGKFIGYGYKSWRAFGLSLVFIAAGFFLFRFGRSRNLILPLKEEDYSVNAAGVPQVKDSYPAFSAFIYSLEAFVPLVKLGMDEHWRLYTNRTVPIQIGLLKLTVSGRWLRWYLWFHIIAGWVLTTLWVGALTGLAKT